VDSVGFEQNYSFYSSDIKIELVESRAALESWLVGSDNPTQYSYFALVKYGIVLTSF
jgi:hypothetical protein